MISIYETDLLYTSLFSMAIIAFTMADIFQAAVHFISTKSFLVASFIYCVITYLPNWTYSSNIGYDVSLHIHEDCKTLRTFIARFHLLMLIRWLCSIQRYRKLRCHSFHQVVLLLFLCVIFFISLYSFFWGGRVKLEILFARFMGSIYAVRRFDNGTNNLYTIS